MVARTVLNRRLHPRFPTDVCDVVYQPYQFSWTLKKQKTPNTEHWNISAEAVIVAMYVSSPVMYFHAKHINPAWAAQKQVVITVGNHIFYTEKKK